MLQGFAANIIALNGKRCKNALLRTDEGRFHSLLPLSAELPFTRFFDGLLVVLPATAPAPVMQPGITAAEDTVCTENDLNKVAEGDAIAIWQLYPYDVLADCPTAQTRCRRIL